MASLSSPYTPTTRLPVPLPQSVSSPRDSIPFSRQRSRLPRKSIYVVACSPPKALPTTEQEILEIVAQTDGKKEKSLPAVRSYENDLARLTLIGEVAFEQALTAAAADGGEAADEHIASGMPTMVVETIFPGPSEDNSTVSTRLFLPARKVKEKARKLRYALTPDILSSNASKNILAMTFRQVVLHHIWSFELALFSPGTERNMVDLENPREVPAFFTLSSSNERVLSVLAEVVCMSALEDTEKDFLGKSLGRTSNNIFHWFQNPRRIVSKDSSVFIYRMFQDEMVENSKSLLEKFNAVKADVRDLKMKNQWWTSSTYSKLERFGGPEFSAWAREYIPAYRLQIDADKLKDVKFDGWKKSADNRWEVLLTHSQMVGLANILDMYYEDVYTLPDKQLSCRVVSDFTNLSIDKERSLWKLLSIILSSGVILFSIGVLAQLHWPQMVRKRPAVNFPAPVSEVGCYQHQSLEATKLGALCISIVQKIKDAYGWPGGITMDRNIGAWTGELPRYFWRDENALVQEDISSIEVDNIASSVSSDTGNDEIKTSVQDIASYQVVLSKDGKIIGFQPMSRVAVNHWGGNPLAKELYNGKKLSPGLMEPGLKIPRPDEVVVIELLMSINPESWFALARPVQYLSYQNDRGNHKSL
ncbi:uncharacterized protein LOC122640656 isoform X2 [Telopea speciosissima]|uniref:uncharacterized protein LOC122640656 isoform X2 n=1 Tax=Telopea speciosissima TaxID=54955 RepID=UPI001CC506A3|nr:uncharacterized protein LOC122640656 isoform X2 [Telopea speciosissima]